MHDIIDVIKNLQPLSENNSAFKVLKDFERVLDELESQKLTSFAALMDPALMSYRLLLDFCFQDPNRRDAREARGRGRGEHPSGPVGHGK